uniref:Myb/SANT-like domain-containing protein n=1 Tax=Lactuca sativa TaxID=4236 RepID=A0A9R1VMQ5_LACSA|nr:hypothetical protein LSAT_V11C500291910 [Lactuca sativa]
MIIYYVIIFVDMAGRNKHTWTTEEDAKLIEALLELLVSGKYGGTDNGFKPGYLKAVQQLLDVSLLNSGLKVEPHIKSSGFAWDTDKCCVTADVEVWDEYIKIHRGAACFCDKQFPQFDNLCKIFERDKATGHGATDLGEDVTKETQRNSHVDVEGLEEIVEETQQTTCVNSKRKRPPTDDTENSYKEATKEMKETFKEFLRILKLTICTFCIRDSYSQCQSKGLAQKKHVIYNKKKKPQFH